MQMEFEQELSLLRFKKIRINNIISYLTILPPPQYFPPDQAYTKPNSDMHC